MNMLAAFKLRIADADRPSASDVLLEDILAAAGEVIVDYRYPFGGWEVDEDTGSRVVPDRYQSLQVDIAVDIYNKMGAEGQLSHRENGIDRMYASGSVSKDLLRRITPLAALL